MITHSQATDLHAALAQVARAEILPRFRQIDAAQIDAKSGADDLVTIADRAAEATLGPLIAEILPGVTIVGEEAVSADAGLLDRLGDELVAIIDPIDGTWNYAHGIATFGMILAVVEAGQTVWGGLYDPLGEDLVEAHRGAGAWFVKGGTRRPLSTQGRPQSLAEASGVLHTNNFPAPLKPAVAALGPQMRRATHLGASCHDYRTLVLGGVDLALNAMLNPWDHAAGSLIVTEAGGVSRLTTGAPYDPLMRQGRLLNAASEPLWADAIARIAPVLAADPLAR